MKNKHQAIKSVNFINIILFFLMFMIQFNYCYGKGKDSLYFNIKNIQDGIILFEGKYFVRMNISKLNEDTILKVTYGIYKYSNDSIIFDFPDSLCKKNKYFGFYRTKFDDNKRFQFHDKSKSGIPDKVEKLYYKMFNIKQPNYTEIRYFQKVKALKRKNQIEMLEEEGIVTFQYKK